MKTNGHFGVEWVAAALAPWTISPHPNFSQRVITPAAQLALVTERRFPREVERYGPENVENQSEWNRALVAHAEASLLDSTQAHSTAQLWDIAATPNLPVGARAVAALYASVGSAELEEANFAESSLLGLMDEFSSEYSAPKHASASLRLIIASLSQQRVARLFDSQQFDRANDAVSQTLAWVPAAGERAFDDFVVSKGISWKSVRVQDDIARSIRHHALNARVSLEFPDAKSWVNVVKSRAGWIDSRISRLAAESDALVVRDAFELRFESTSGAKHFMRQSAVEAGYSSLLISELSGHIGRIKGDREKLGRIVMLERGSSPGSAREALRLLRQGGGTKSLQSALNFLRNQGPTLALTEDASSILARAELHGWVTESDLQVLGSAADFLSDGQRRSAIEASLRVLDTQQLGTHIGWSVHDRVWKAITQLLPDSGAEELVLEQMNLYLDKPEHLSEPFTSTLARAVRAMEWPRARRIDRARWENWATVTIETLETKELQRSIRSHQTGAHDMLPMDLTLERAAFMADDRQPAGIDESKVTEMSEYLVDAMRSEAEQARNGVTRFGGYNTANVAVAYAMRFSSEMLWSEIASFLIDQALDAELKADALDRMARFVDSVPVPVKEIVSSNAQAILQSKREDHFFASKTLPVFAEALRLIAAIGALPPDKALSHTMELAAGDDISRTEAAKTIPHVMVTADSTWGHSLLLQLSHDKNPVVRAEAASGLVLSLHFDSALLETVKLRIALLLDEDGVRTPALMLHAIRRQSESRPDTVATMEPIVENKTGVGSPRLIRRIATDTLTSMRRSRPEIPG